MRRGSCRKSGRRTPDAGTEKRRRLVARRHQIVRHRTRIKNEVHAVLHAHLIPKCPHADLFNRRGRARLTAQPLPDDEQAAIERHIRELDRLGEDLAVLDREIAQGAMDDPDVRHLLTITGVNLVAATGLLAAIGDIGRFKSPQKLVSFFGLNPRVRQSGLGAAHHGRISKAGRSHACAMLVEAAWAAAKVSGPLHAFFVRIRAKRGHQIAAVVVARKLAVLCWHLLTKGEDYHWARPALVAKKLRDMELAAGAPQEKGNKRGAFPDGVRRIVYTTDEIESLNAKLRRAVRTRGHFPTDDAATKLLWLVLNRAADEWKRPPREWFEARAQFAIMFGERFCLA